MVFLGYPHPCFRRRRGAQIRLRGQYALYTDRPIKHPPGQVRAGKHTHPPALTQVTLTLVMHGQQGTGVPRCRLAELILMQSRASSCTYEAVDASMGIDVSHDCPYKDVTLCLHIQGHSLVMRVRVTYVHVSRVVHMHTACTAYVSPGRNVRSARRHRSPGSVMHITV